MISSQHEIGFVQNILYFRVFGANCCELSFFQKKRPGRYTTKLKNSVHTAKRQALARSSSRRDVRGRLLLDRMWLNVAVMALPAGWRRSLCT